MATVFLCPIYGAGSQFFTNQGVILPGGKLNVYAAGSLTPQTTFTDVTGAVANANPIILDSAGRLTQEIWAVAGTKLKFILTDSTNASVGPTVDNIPLVNDVSTASATSIWSASGITPSYVNATQFSASGDQTLVFPVGSRLKYTVTAGTFYGTVSASSYTPTTTTVTVSADSTALDSGLSVVQISPITVVGSPADANAVTYKPTITQAAGSIGAAVQALGKTTTTAGTSTAYTLTPANAISSYVSGTTWLVSFNQTSGAAPTMNISGQGAKNLKQYDNGGNKIAATVYSGQLSMVGYDGTDLIVMNPIKAGSTLQRITTFTATGTWTKQAGVSSVIAEGVGAGGGAYSGGVGGGGGGAGAYFKKYVSAPGSTETVTVGTGGVSGSPGGAGTVSSFGAWGSANGGAAATSVGGYGAGGAGGAAGAGDVALAGSGGDYGGAWAANIYFGKGGDSHFGGGAQGDVNRVAGVTGYANTGGGGSGGSTGGGTGGTGIVIVYEYG